MSGQRASQLIEAGLWLRLSGDHDGAKRLFEQALRLDPGNARARQLLEASRGTSAAPAAVKEPSRPPVPDDPDLIRSDWAMATGFLEERRLTPAAEMPKVVVSPDASVAPEDTAPAPPPLPSVAPPIAPLARTLTPVTQLAQQSWGAGLEGEDEPLGPPPEELPPEPLQSAWETEAGPGEQLSMEGTGGGEAMDLVVEELPRSATPPPAPYKAASVAREVQALLKGARDLLELDDHSGAMELITKAETLSPEDPDVQRLRQRSEQTLLAMFESKLGSLERRPRVQMKPDEIIWLNLDHRAGFVLAQIDGTVTLEEVFAVSGMSRLDTARILSQLVEEGVITAG